MQSAIDLLYLTLFRAFKADADSHSPQITLLNAMLNAISEGGRRKRNVQDVISHFAKVPKAREFLAILANACESCRMASHEGISPNLGCPG